MVNNLFRTAILDDLNVKSSFWHNNNITTYEGSKIEGVTSKFGLQQIIKEPTHIIGDTNYLLNYPPHYKRQALHFQKANVNQIRQAISEFPWDNLFANINVTEQVQTIQNIISNYSPNKGVWWNC